MDESSDRTALLSALTTEHFVLQTANSATYTEASARSSLYVMALSSSLVAMGFLANDPPALWLFAATVVPAVLLLGLFSVVRLVETSLESMHYLAGIARIRGYYRTLGPEAALLFAKQTGRWPEIDSPAERLGPFVAFLGTTASMIAVINSIVAGAAVALLIHATSKGVGLAVCMAAGAGTALVSSALFYRYQHWRFADFDAAGGTATEG